MKKKIYQLLLVAIAAVTVSSCVEPYYSHRSYGYERRHYHHHRDYDYGRY